MNVAILSAARKVWLVQAFQRALAATGGGAVWALDCDPRAAALQLADRAQVAPRSDDPAFPGWLADWCRRKAVTVVVPTRDEELPVLAGLAEDFSRNGVRVAVSPPAGVADCRDKRRFAARCAGLGLATPREITVPTAADFPAFVKPRGGKGGRGAGRIESLAALQERGFAPEREILQEVVTDPEYTIDVFLDAGGRPVSAVPRERVRVEAGESVVARTVRDDELAGAAVRLAVGLGLRFHVTVQAFRAPGRIRFIEVNPRYGGGAALGFAAGCPTPEWLVRLARGEPLVSLIGEYTVGLWMYRYATDRFVAEPPAPRRPEAHA